MQEVSGSIPESPLSSRATSFFDGFLFVLSFFEEYTFALVAMSASARNIIASSGPLFAVAFFPAVLRFQHHSTKNSPAS